MNPKNTKQSFQLFQDIRFWIGLFFLIRLIGITNPPLEEAHSWRQTTVTMVARNFLEIDNNIFYPRIDIAGDKTGITGMEFPILNYLIYLMAKIFGYQHWYGRLINLIVSSFGIWYFYKLIKKYFDKKAALYSGIILLSSLWFAYSRKIMPDTFSVSLMLAGIYYGTNYLDSKQNKKGITRLLLYAVLIMLGTLAKLPAGYLLILFIIPFLDKAVSLKKKLWFTITSVIALLPTFVWYFYWVPYLVEQYGFWHFFMGKGIAQGMVEIADNLLEASKKFYEDAMKFIGFAMFIFGLIKAVALKRKLLLQLFVLTFSAYLIIVFKGGYTFAYHSYYIIPFVPVMALFAGFGISMINKQWLVNIFLAAIMLEGVLNQMHDFTIHKEKWSLLSLENNLDKISNRDDLIIINSGNNPTPLYFTHRKGWVKENAWLQNSNHINDLKQHGLKYIVILKKAFGSAITLNYPIVFENEDYRVYKMQQ